ncbi:HEAT repeat [Carpediemonas membranifera]|uniref:HEAT repeat n=1 Tax=Carpediemonas membranifera TaxID=201153 RepID=A0A8J6B555_9EUKA|nr:HEAT repeat [Carpediemonas membranifera]|eukprot:KAG9390252.1 HEAT repeat [Carpediemonas membranifera]
MELLMDNQAEPHTRGIAAMALKIAAKKPMYMQLPAELRCAVRENILSALSVRENHIRRQISIAASAVAVVEVNNDSWPEFFSRVGQACYNPAAPNQIDDSTKIAYLTVMQYVCEDVEKLKLVPHSKALFEAIVNNMGVPSGLQVSTEVQEAATNALVPIIVMATELPDHLNVLSIVLDKIEQGQTPELRTAAMQALVRAIEVKYESVYDPVASGIPPLPDQTTVVQRVVQATLKAIAATGQDDMDADAVAMPAIEFWCQAADNEIDSDATNTFLASHCQAVLPVLLNALVANIEDAVDPDEWCVATACTTALSLIARAVGDAVVTWLVKPIVDALTAQGRPVGEVVAAITAIGAVVEDSSTAAVQPLLQPTLPVIVGALSDSPSPTDSVRDAASWCLGRICEHHFDVFSSDNDLNFVMSALYSRLTSEQEKPSVVSNTAWAFSKIGRHFMELTDRDVSLWITPMIKCLLRAAQRPDADQANLGAACFGAIDMLIRAMPEGSPRMGEMMDAVYSELGVIYSAVVSSSDMPQSRTVIYLEGMCNCLRSLATVAPAMMRPKIDQQLVQTVCILANKDQHPDVAEDALYAISAFTDACEDALVPMLLAAQVTTSHGAIDGYQVILADCDPGEEAADLQATAIGVVSDLIRAAPRAMRERVALFVSGVLNMLQSGRISEGALAAAYQALGDVALYLPTVFEPRFAAPLFSSVLETTHKEAKQFERVNQENELGIAGDEVDELIDGAEQVLDSTFVMLRATFLAAKQNAPLNEFLTDQLRSVAAMVSALLAVADNQFVGEEIYKAGVFMIYDWVALVGTRAAALEAQQRKIVDAFVERLHANTQDANSRAKAAATQQLLTKVGAR